ncbi:MAG: Unknown protein [uncultured Sulfurovum sp.]|uniref:Uncharacterized protein n=1 Tax=uncultured Sulfurovum sp. TaxID=269237 RepID=A0A6S6T9V0_9BACT|nr:MAG: Unknown protein [uncultured Sulfurovum sp.]
MDTPIHISFNVTAKQKETIHSRMTENGFNDISSYLKVVALKTQTFTFTSAGMESEEALETLQFKITPSQKEKLDEKMKESGCETLTSYLQYVALHAVVTAVVEVRSTGGFEDMLARIANSRKK